MINDSIKLEKNKISDSRQNDDELGILEFGEENGLLKGDTHIGLTNYGINSLGEHTMTAELSKDKKSFIITSADGMVGLAKGTKYTKK